MKSTITDQWGPFTVVPNEFIASSLGLSDHARWLFVLLRYHTNGQTQTAFPSYMLLKQETGWGTKTIAKAIHELEDAGWLTRKKQYGGNTHYILVRPNPNGIQSFPMDSTVPRKVQSFPTESTVLSNGKTTKIESTKTEKNKKETPPPSPVQDWSILEDIFPGYATNIATMRDLRDLCKRVNATPEMVIEFPGWLKTTYPYKAFGIFPFKELLSEFVKTRRPAVAPAPARRQYCGQCTEGWLPPLPGQEGMRRCKCTQPAPTGESNGNSRSTNSHVSF